MKILYVLIFVFFLLAISAFLYDKRMATFYVGFFGGLVEAKYDLLFNRYNLTDCDLVGCYEPINICGDCPQSYKNLNDPVLIEQDKIFLNKYGMTHRRICGPSSGQSSESVKFLKKGYSWGYNSLSYRAIEKRNGEYIYEKVEKEAIQEVLKRNSMPQDQKEAREKRLALLR
jgi:hypothetical protein